MLMAGGRVVAIRIFAGIESPIVRHLLAQRVANLTPDALVFAPVTRQTPFASDHLYKKLKGYVAAGRWFPCGSSVDENDANVPSAESLVRHVLYGNRYKGITG